jgi:hypothetical protein
MGSLGRRISHLVIWKLFSHSGLGFRAFSFFGDISLSIHPTDHDSNQTTTSNLLASRWFSGTVMPHANA